MPLTIDSDTPICDGPPKNSSLTKATMVGPMPSDMIVPIRKYAAMICPRNWLGTTLCKVAPGRPCKIPKPKLTTDRLAKSDVISLKIGTTTASGANKSITTMATINGASI